MIGTMLLPMIQKVAPYAGAWIEIAECSKKHRREMSLPTRERGLKYYAKMTIGVDGSRSLRGSVD